MSTGPKVRLCCWAGQHPVCLVDWDGDGDWDWDGDGREGLKVLGVAGSCFGYRGLGY